MKSLFIQKMDNGKKFQKNGRCYFGLFFKHVQSVKIILHVTNVTVNVNSNNPDDYGKYLESVLTMLINKL
jgi:hypothetical protein